jgi:hypothetical protein
VAAALTVHWEVANAEAESGWLDGECGVDLGKVQELLKQRWRALRSVPHYQSEGDLCLDYHKRIQTLLSEGAEEPHSYVLGHVGLAFISAKRLPEQMRALLGASEDHRGLDPEKTEVALRRFEGALSLGADRIVRALQTFDRPRQALLSQLFVWPARVFVLAQRGEGDKRALVKLFRRCIRSGIWLQTGRSAGSWGNNLQNTQRILTAAAAFWRFAFEREAEFAPLFDELGDGDGPTGSVKAVE